MSIDIQWHTDQCSILVVRFGASFTVESLLNALDDLRRMVNSKKHPVDIVVDLTPVQKAPSGLLPNLALIGSERPQNMRRIVLVGLDNRPLLTTADIYSRLFHRLYYFRTMDEAFNMLASVDS